MLMKQPNNSKLDLNNADRMFLLSALPLHQY